MAKDGTVRGGPRRGTGPKPKPLSEKIQGGQPARYMPNELPELDLSELEAVDLPEGAALEGADMPKPGEYLSAKETWLWLKQRGCENLVNKRLIESFAQAFARHIQCEEAISTYGLLGKHPTTGGVMESPFVKMSMLFQKNANLAWYEIYSIVKENCTADYSGASPQDDLMERLLRSRKG